MASPAPGELSRQVAGGLALRLARYPLQALFLLVVPSLLGAERYGVYATCSALWALAARATDVGTDPVFGRLVPGLAPEAAGRVVRQVLWLRLALALGPGALLVALLFPGGADRRLLALVVAAVALVPCQEVLFASLYARGRISRYMARDPLAAAISLVAVVAGYLAFGLAGAVAALAAGQAGLALVGLAWARPRASDLAPPRDLAGLGPLLRFGVAAALPATLTVVALKLGTPVLAGAGWPAPAVAGFDLAVHVLSLASALAAYPFVALLPALGRLTDAGGADAALARMRRVVRVLAAGAAALVVGLVAVGEAAVRRLLGAGFEGLYPSLLVLVGLGLFPALVAQVAFGLAVLARVPHATIAPAAVLAGLTAAGTFVLAPPFGAAGAAAALLAGLLAQAAVLLVVTPGLAGLVVRPLVAAGLPALPALGLAALEAAGLVSLGLPHRLAAAAPLIALAARSVMAASRSGSRLVKLGPR